jgi:hypothetical protein
MNAREARWPIRDAVRLAGRGERGRVEPRPIDRALDPTSEPTIGSHIVTPRQGYTHHGIYVGEKRVVQYGGLSRGLRRGPVEEVSLSQFAQGREIRVRSYESAHFDREVVIWRARVRLGEDRYHPLKNNCEHFCEWCARGTPRSYQVEDLSTGSARTWSVLLKLLYRGLFDWLRSCDAMHRIAGK